jgi:hypothetical protein
MERDGVIVSEIARWRYCLGRQLRILAGFTGQRATDRRLQKLMQVGYIQRRHILYGVPGLYFVTNKGLEDFGLDMSLSNIRLDQLSHDIAVIDTAIYFILSHGIARESIKTEKEIRKELGFNPRIHQPDFIYTQNNKKYCVEVEMTLKTKERIEKITKDNYLKYDEQSWIVPKNRIKIREILSIMSKKYSNIKLLDLDSVTEYVKNCGIKCGSDNLE